MTTKTTRRTSTIRTSARGTRPASTGRARSKGRRRGGWLRSLLRLLGALGRELRADTRIPAGATRIGPKGAALVGPSRSGRRPGKPGGGGNFDQFQRSRPDLFPGIDPDWDEDPNGWDDPDESGEVAG